MGAVSHASWAFGIVFVVCLAAAAAALLLAFLGSRRRTLLIGISAGIGVAMVASWVAAVLRPSLELAVASAGITATFLVSLAAFAVARVLLRVRRIDQEIERARIELRTLIEREFFRIFTNAQL